jgi:hypothetical protein
MDEKEALKSYWKFSAEQFIKERDISKLVCDVCMKDIGEDVCYLFVIGNKLKCGPCTEQSLVRWETSGKHRNDFGRGELDNALVHYMSKGSMDSLIEIKFHIGCRISCHQNPNPGPLVKDSWIERWVQTAYRATRPKSGFKEITVPCEICGKQLSLRVDSFSRLQKYRFISVIVCLILFGAIFVYTPERGTIGVTIYGFFAWSIAYAWKHNLSRQGLVGLKLRAEALDTHKLLNAKGEEIVPWW